MASSNLAALAISVKETPLQRAEDVDAERVQCALKVAVLMPDFSRVSTTQRAMVLAEMGLSRQNFHRKSPQS